MRQSPLNTGRQDVSTGSGSSGRFHGLYHQHVGENCEGASDAGNHDGDNETNL